MAREGMLAKMWNVSLRRVVSKGERVGEIPCIGGEEDVGSGRLRDDDKAVVEPGDKGRVLPKGGVVGTDPLQTEETARASNSRGEEG